MKRITASPVFDFAPYLEGYSKPYIFGVGTDGTIYCCAAKTTESWRFKNKGGASFGKTRFDKPTDYIILAWNGSELKSTELHNESTVVHRIQPHPEGILLACANCFWRPESVEQNVIVMRWDGTVVSRSTFGHGINDIRTTSDGTAWVGYGDTGIFGSFGWGRQGGPRPIGAPGLVAFDRDGEQTWSYDFRVLGRKIIDDVYALNVTGNDDVWVYFYYDFPIVNIHQGKYTAWSCERTFAPALAVDQQRVLLAGKHGKSAEEHGLIQVLRLNEDGSSSLIEEKQLVDQDGQLISGNFCNGVGKSLYAFIGSQVLKVQDW